MYSTKSGKLNYMIDKLYYMQIFHEYVKILKWYLLKLLLIPGWLETNKHAKDTGKQKIASNNSKLVLHLEIPFDLIKRKFLNA